MTSPNLPGVLDYKIARRSEWCFRGVRVNHPDLGVFDSCCTLLSGHSGPHMALHAVWPNEDEEPSSSDEPGGAS